MRLYRRMHGPMAALAVIAATVSVGGLTDAQARTTAAQPFPPPARSPATPAPPPASTLGAQFYKSTDVAVTGDGDDDGYHLSYALEREGFGWRPLATVLPEAGLDTQWTGQQCLTGDGTEAIVVVAPSDAANDPVAKARGAYAYAVSVPSGKVRLLAAGVSLAYYDPGCGTGHQAVLTRELGDVDSGHQSTELLTVDASTGKTNSDQTVADAQLTSAVPSADGSVVAAEATRIVRVAGSRTRLLATAPGSAFSLVPRAGGRVDLLAATGTTATAEEITQTGTVTAIGSGPLATARLMLGRGGKATAVNLAGPATTGLRRLTDETAPSGDSLEGDILVTVRQSKPKASAANPLGVSLPPTVETLASATGKTSETVTPEPIAPAASTAAPAAATTSKAAPRAVTRPEALAAAPTGGTPTCSVPRDDPSKQVTQPARQQVEWTADQAVRNNLTGTRPAGWHNDGLASYSPQGTDLPRHTLTGYTGTAIPPQVLLGVLAQESNMDQASFHALPGIAGNPNVADYYGAAGGLSTINYAASDCGYGIGQITTGMKAADTSPYSTNGKTKIAIDYWENIAAAQQVLADKWNQLAALSPSTVFNGGDPQYVENWYGALWAYNTGVHTPADAQGQFGLGWTNNPINPDYPPNRAGFLRTSYADAATPGDWPYQERVLGWAETSQLDYTGASSYAPPTYASSNSAHQLYLPPVGTFCSLSVNDCDPSYHPDNGAQGNSVDYCELSGRNCYWHGPANWVPTSPSGTCASYCATGTYTYSTSATEPTLADPHPADCNSSLPSNAVIVDDEPSVAAGQAGLNIVGCTAVNWTGAGTFGLTYGTDANGAPLSVIDTHQLGAAFGGHEYFTHNVASTDMAHQVTGTWTPTLPAAQAYDVKVHIPSTGGSSAYVHYKITTASGQVIDQVLDTTGSTDRWAALGYYSLGSNAQVTMTNVTDDKGFNHDVSYDAIAFIPVSGTVTTHTYDGVQILPAVLDLTSNTPSWLITTPFQNMQTLYDWGNQYSSGAAGTTDWKSGQPYSGQATLPVCSATPYTSACVAPDVRNALNTWHAAVVAGGNSTSGETETNSESSWLGFADPKPPQTITGSTFSNPATYKAKSHITVSWLVLADGSVANGSINVTADFLTGDTRLPPFLVSFMKTMQQDYGIAVPNLAYDDYDLHRANFETSHADPLNTGVAPAQSYASTLLNPVPSTDNKCVDVKTFTGGVIGLRPLVAQQAVDGSVNAWAQAIQAAVATHQVPQTIADTAAQIYSTFFAPPSGTYPSDTYSGSIFNHAPPIWQQWNLHACVDGTSSPINSQHTTIVETGLLPNLWVWKDGNPIDASGNAQGTPNSPAVAADYYDYTHSPSPAPGTGGSLNNPFGFCDTTTGYPRKGNPWDVEFDDTPGVRPTAFQFCDAVGVYRVDGA